jgi:hypothetical protein
VASHHSPIWRTVAAPTGSGATLAARGRHVRDVKQQVTLQVDLQAVGKVDEAHLLQPDQLEELRLLANAEMDSASPFAGILAGQPTMNRQLRMGMFAALDQRIATRFSIKPMDLAESAAYLRHHLALAGREEPLFADDAIARLHRVASGSGRKIGRPLPADAGRPPPRARWAVNGASLPLVCTCSGAKFSGGTVYFVGATFSGGLVSFHGATFSGGTIYFGTAKFSGGFAEFDQATFSGGTVYFGATFSDGLVRFGHATFSGGTVHFLGATFSGGTVGFTGATFASGQVNFTAATFSGGEVDFSNVGDWSCPPEFPWAGTPPPSVKLPRKEGQVQGSPGDL